MLVCWLCSLLWPPSKSQLTRYLCSALASPAECHITWPHINTHTDVEMQKVRPAVRTLKIPTEDVSRRPREARLGLEGIWRKSMASCSVCSHKLGTVLFLTPLNRGSTPEHLVLESIAKIRGQTHQPGWWILQYFGLLAELPLSWRDRTGVQDLPKSQWIIVDGYKQRHKVSGQQIANDVLVSTINYNPERQEYPGGCRCEYPGGCRFLTVPSFPCLPSLLSLISATCRFRDSC